MDTKVKTGDRYCGMLITGWVVFYRTAPDSADSREFLSRQKAEEFAASVGSDCVLPVTGF
jgi:hypothetical protein